MLYDEVHNYYIRNCVTFRLITTGQTSWIPVHCITDVSVVSLKYLTWPKLLEIRVVILQCPHERGGQAPSCTRTLKGSLFVQTASESIDRIGTLEVNHDGVVHV